MKRLISVLACLVVVGCSRQPTTPSDTPSNADRPESSTAASAGTDAADLFDRADGPPGPNWAWQPGLGSPIIRNGRLGTTDEELVIAWWAGRTFGPDQFSEAVVAPQVDWNATNGLQVFVRRRGAGVPWRYGFHFNFRNGQYEIKLDGGSNGVVLASTPGGQFTTGDIVRIEVRANTIRALVNGVQKLSVSNSSLTDGQTGLVINPSNVASRYAWDAWRGGALR